MVGEGLIDLIIRATITSSEVTEVGTIMELAFLPVICERATDADIAELRAMCDAHEAARKDGSYTVEISLQFHRALAGCAHNSAATLLLGALRDPILKSLQEAHHVGTSGVEEHRRVVDAVAARDLHRAVAELRQHLDRTVRATTVSER